jgi:hypothetical protein
MDDLSKKSPEELIGGTRLQITPAEFTGYEELYEIDLSKVEYDELLRELRAYRAMQAKVKEIKNQFGGVARDVCNDILAAGEEAHG